MNPTARVEQTSQPSYRGGAPVRCIALEQPKLGALDLAMAALLWLLSGSPILTYAPYFNASVIGGVAILTLYALIKPVIYPGRIALLAVLGVSFVLWTSVWVSSHDLSQIKGLIGHLLKMAAAGLFVAACPRPGEALVRSMVWLAGAALVIFGARQLLLLAGFDLADLFNWLYPLLGVEPDRSILIFNFDIESEISRNSGPFREPGLFAAYLVIALMILLAMTRDNPRERVTTRRELQILSLALLSTQSTMGLAAGAVLLAMWLVGGRSIGTGWTILIVIGAGVAGALLWSSGGQSDKLIAQADATYERKADWHTTRIGNAYVDRVAIETNPWMGYGFAEEGRPILWDSIETPGFGNGMTGTAVKFGIPFAILIYIFFVFGLARMYRSALLTILGTATVAALLIGQQLLTLPLAFALVTGLSRPRAKRQ